MPMTKGMYSSETDEWETPQEVFDHYNRLFDFNLDVCANEDNAKTYEFYDKEENGLLDYNPWLGCCWMNPPYGRQIGDWVEKAYRESQHGNCIVCLLPARTDTRWWQDYVTKADSIHFIRGRLKFGGQTNSAPFPSAIVIFGLHYRK